MFTVHNVYDYRGGILEPEGTVEIKFRQQALGKTMERLDNKCIEIKEKLQNPDTTKVNN
jgi:hypothetical protein